MVAFSELDVEGRFSSVDLSLDCDFEGRAFWGRLGRIGGGSSMFSAAFRDSCLAKSDACHHSKNLSAKMLVGSRILIELSNLGVTVLAIFLGLNILPPSPGLAGPTFLGWPAISIAL